MRIGLFFTAILMLIMLSVQAEAARCGEDCVLKEPVASNLACIGSRDSTRCPFPCSGECACESTCTSYTPAWEKFPNRMSCGISFMADKCTDSHNRRGYDFKGRYLAEKRELQRAVDRELKLCPAQKQQFAEGRRDYFTQAQALQRLYFADRSLSLEDLNHRLTLLGLEHDRWSRRMLNPLQDAVFPEHMWMLYSNTAWNKGFRPGSSHVLHELLDEHWFDCRKRSLKRCEFAGMP